MRDIIQSQVLSTYCWFASVVTRCCASHHSHQSRTQIQVPMIKSSALRRAGQKARKRKKDAGWITWRLEMREVIAHIQPTSMIVSYIRVGIVHIKMKFFAAKISLPAAVDNTSCRSPFCSYAFHCQTRLCNKLSITTLSLKYGLLIFNALDRGISQRG